MTAVADPDLDAIFAQALAKDAQVTAPELPAPPRRNVSSDPDAPHGVGEDGEPLTPFGTNKKTGRPNLRPPGPGRPGKDKSGEPRVREATPEDVVPPKGKSGGKAKPGELAPQDFAGPLMEASEAIWFGGSMLAKVGPQIPLIGKFVPGRKLSATMAVFDSERPRLCMALNLAAQHDQRARGLAVKLAAGEVSWALTVMFMVAPFAGATAAVWQTSEKHDVLGERELPSLDELTATNEGALDAMLARIAGQMQAAQAAVLAEAQAQADASLNGQGAAS